MKKLYLKVPIELLSKAKEQGITNPNAVVIYSLILNNYFCFNRMNWGNKKICDELQITKTQLCHVLKELQDKGWIEIQRNVTFNDKKHKRIIIPKYNVVRYKSIHNKQKTMIRYIAIQYEAIKLFAQYNFTYNRALLVWSRIENIQDLPALKEYTITMCGKEFCVSRRMCSAYFRELQDKGWMYKENGVWKTVDLSTLSQKQTV